MKIYLSSFRVLYLRTVTALLARIPVTANRRRLIIQHLQTQIKENYISAETAIIMADKIAEGQQSGAYDHIRDAKDFARMLTGDVRSVYNDKHFLVRFAPPMFREVSKGKWLESKKEKKRRLDQGKKINFGFAAASVIENDIGYIRLTHCWELVPAAKAAADAAMQTVSQARGLIFDLRENQGGDPAMLKYLLGFLFALPTHYNDVFERRKNRWTSDHTVPNEKNGLFASMPVCVLNSLMTFSAAEEFAYDLQTQKRALIIGEKTGGGAHHIDILPLAYHFVVHVPIKRSVNPITKTNWEGVGIIPDVAVPASEALPAAIRILQSK